MTLFQPFFTQDLFGYYTQVLWNLSIGSIGLLDSWGVTAKVYVVYLLDMWYLGVRSWKSSLLFYEHFILVIVCYLTRIRSAIPQLPYGMEVCDTPKRIFHALVLTPKVPFSPYEQCLGRCYLERGIMIGFQLSTFFGWVRSIGSNHFPQGF